MASRFTFNGKYSMRPQPKAKGSMLAYFDCVDTKLGLEFRDMRLIEGKNGVFCSAPSRDYEDSEGETKYINYWGPAWDEDEGARDERGMSYMDEMAEAAYEAFERVQKKGKKSSRKVVDDDDEDEEEDEAPAKKKKAKTKAKPTGKSGRGPVPRADEDDEDEDEEEDDIEDADDEDEDEDDDEDEEVEVKRPAKKSAKPSARGKSAPASKGKRKLPF